MSQATSIPTTRRRFSKWLAAAAARGGAAAAMPATALASSDDDSELLHLEKQVFEAWETSHAHDGEIRPLTAACRADYERRLQEEKRQLQFLS